MAHQHRGTLYMRIGPMYAGKTTWLNGELLQKSINGFKVCKIIYIDDNRPDTPSNNVSGSTHNPSYKELPDSIRIFRAKNLSEVDDLIDQYHVIGIDEGQFFTDLNFYVTKWVEELSKHVRVVGLDGDSDKNPFGDILTIIPIADKCKKISTDNCQLCLDELAKSQFKGNIFGIKAPFTKVLTEKSKQILIGGKESYIAVCRYHHNN